MTRLTPVYMPAEEMAAVYETAPSVVAVVTFTLNVRWHVTVIWNVSGLAAEARPARPAMHTAVNISKILALRNM
jgi:hypothetical protein